MRVRKWRNAGMRLCILSQFMAAALILPAAAHAQSATASPSQPASDERVPAIRRLGYLIGSWAGIRQENGPDGKPRPSLSMDEIRYAWGGKAITIDGRGHVGVTRDTEPKGGNFAIITGHQDPDRIRLTGFAPGGGVMTGEGVVDANGSARWTMSSGLSMLNFEFHPIKPDGWHEIGRISRDGGKTWHEFAIKFHRDEQ